MLLNPFMPFEIASLPEDFFGRVDELQVLERSIAQGSVVIHGVIGIGKSSLLAQIGLIMEGFNSGHSSKVVVAVGNKDIETIDDAARLILERFVNIDEDSSKIKINLGKIIEWESSEICRYFAKGRHLAALLRILENENIKQPELLILAVDEAGKCPIPLAQLIRNITTHVQHQGIHTLRFLLAGVNPFYQLMVDEDAGIKRFFYRIMSVVPLPEEEARELIDEKFKIAVEDAVSKGLELEIDEETVERVVQLSGGHPHVLQLLGSHLIEHEVENPDGIINARDLVSTLRAICYQDRGLIYESLIHTLEIDGLLDPLKQLFTIASPKLPITIDRERAEDVIEPETLKQLVMSDILSVSSANEYRITDEFLHIRIVMDKEQSAADTIEDRLIKSGSLEDESEDWPSDIIDDDEE